MGRNPHFVERDMQLVLRFDANYNAADGKALDEAITEPAPARQVKAYPRASQVVDVLEP